MASSSSLELQYNLSKRSFLRKPSRLLSAERQNSGLLSSYQVNVDELKQVFDKFDLNKDGKISPDEYMAILKALGSRCLISKEVKKIFEVADLNGDGFIDFKEFLEVQQKEGGVRIEDLQSAFRTFDMDGDGKITVDEVFELLKRLGEKCSMKDCRKMVRVVDTNGDGVIDMDEFLTMMTRTMSIR